MKQDPPGALLQALEKTEPFVPWFGTTTTATTSNPGHRQKKGHLNSWTDFWVPEVTVRPGRLLMATRKLLALLGSPRSKAL